MQRGSLGMFQVYESIEYERSMDGSLCFGEGMQFLLFLFTKFVELQYLLCRILVDVKLDLLPICFLQEISIITIVHLQASASPDLYMTSTSLSISACSSFLFLYRYCCSFSSFFLRLAQRISQIFFRSYYLSDTFFQPIFLDILSIYYSGVKDDGEMGRQGWIYEQLQVFMCVAGCQGSVEITAAELEHQDRFLQGLIVLLTQSSEIPKVLIPSGDLSGISLECPEVLFHLLQDILNGLLSNLFQGLLHFRQQWLILNKETL